MLDGFLEDANPKRCSIYSSEMIEYCFRQHENCVYLSEEGSIYSAGPS